MKYRSSYGQNLLQHSREVAAVRSNGIRIELTQNLLSEQDYYTILEKFEEETKSHAILGMQWAEKHGEKPEVCNAMGAHHDEIEMTSLLSPIVQVCDAGFWCSSWSTQTSFR